MLGGTKSDACTHPDNRVLTLRTTQSSPDDRTINTFLRTASIDAKLVDPEGQFESNTAEYEVELLATSTDVEFCSVEILVPFFFMHSGFRPKYIHIHR